MTNSKFIKVGEQRIRLSNIKEYGIFSGHVYRNSSGQMYERIPKMPAPNLPWDWHGLEPVEIRWAAIETYQGDYFRFYENQYDIEEIVARIDAAV